MRSQTQPHLWGLYSSTIAEKQLSPRTKTDIVSTMAYLHLPVSEYFVIGGANLVLRGIKIETTDIDMLVTDSVFKWLQRHKGSEVHDPPASAIEQGADNTSVFVKNDKIPIPISATTSLGDGYYPMTFNSHLPYTEMIKGINCLGLEQVRAAKEALLRPNDVEDLRAIAHFLGGAVDLPAPTDLSPVQEG